MIARQFVIPAIALIAAASSCGAFRFTVPGGMSPIADYEHNIPNCDDMIPESAAADTSCYSSCANGVHDETLECSRQAESYLFKLSLNQKTFRETYPGTKGCNKGNRRYLCTSQPSSGQHCEGVKDESMKDGDECYTKCGVTNCPTKALAPGNRFRDTVPKSDFKIADCEFGSHRLRCAVQVPSRFVLPERKLHPLHGATLEF